MKHLPIVRPKHPTATQMLPQMQQILNSGVVTNNGPFVQQFEARLMAVLGIPTIVFSSGMAALIAMLRAADVAGGEVICPSFTFAATPHAIVLAGATPVFSDVSEDNLALENGEARSRITPRTKAILPVDPYGVCWTRNIEFDVPVLIDAAASFGSTDRGLLASHRGTQIFSFHATKAFSTMEGGALCSHDPELMERAKAIRNFGQSADGDCRIVGFNGKMTEVCAAVGLKQLDEFDHRSQRRMESAFRLREALNDIGGLRAYRAPLAQAPIWTYQPVFVEPDFGASRDSVVSALWRAGIQARLYYRACHLLSCYASGEPLPVTERLASQVISLPVYDHMTREEIAHIANTLRETQRCRS